MSLQRWPGDGSQVWYPQGSEADWNGTQHPLTVGDPQYRQNNHLWQQLPRASDLKVSDIDSVLGARPKRELQHASWNQDVVFPTSSQPTYKPWHLQPHRKHGVAMTEPYLRPRPGGSSVTTVDSGYESYLSTSGPSNHSLPSYQQLPMLKSPEPSIRTEYHFSCPDPPQSIASEPVRNLPDDISPRKAATRARTHIPPCPDCQKEFKNNSEANKHKLQHERPFRCVEDGCNRKKGFATKNDLERHRKTVHHKAPRVGKTERFICAACPTPQQGSVAKLWLRRDNFKAHIHRKHPGYPEEILIDRSQAQKAADEMSVSGHESVTDITKTDPMDTSLRLTGDSPLYESYGNNIHWDQGDFPFAFGYRNPSNGLATVGCGSVTDAASNRASEMDVSLWRTGQEKNSDAQYQIPSIMSPLLAPVQDQSHGSCAPTLRITTVDGADNELMLPLPVVQQHSPNHLSIPLSNRCSVGSSSSGSDHGDGEFECRECGKRKLRECDLTKHMKRHTRPYGCTFPDCWKRFGSRNDWNRHEFAQHARVEMWRCRLPRRGQQTCGKVCYTVDDMRTHLKSSEHTQILSAGPDDECEAAYIGAYGRVNFWCGFCDALIPTTSTADSAAWAMRSKHIGDHYDKDCRKIEDWVCGKENRSNRGVAQREKKVVKPTSKMTFGKYGPGGNLEDDSDLGDDGIPI